MKFINKLFVLLIISGISISSFAGLKSKQVVGEWKSSIVVSNSEMSGSFIFYKESSELHGEYIDSEGNKSIISNIIINKKNNTLCFQINRDTDIPIEFILIVEGRKFRGKGWINEANFEITGEKLK